uniref:Uncharacterized protein n=1 Tax=Chelonoidis abingdonii TaxID=106734 RepID=A0A8C0H0B8_CHEAB
SLIIQFFIKAEAGLSFDTIAVLKTVLLELVENFPAEHFSIGKLDNRFLNDRANIERNESNTKSMKGGGPSRVKGRSFWGPGCRSPKWQLEVALPGAVFFYNLPRQPHGSVRMGGSHIRRISCHSP